jgi:hypothetical protein
MVNGKRVPHVLPLNFINNPANQWNFRRPCSYLMTLTSPLNKRQVPVSCVYKVVTVQSCYLYVFLAICVGYAWVAKWLCIFWIQVVAWLLQSISQCDESGLMRGCDNTLKYVLTWWYLNCRSMTHTLFTEPICMVCRQHVGEAAAIMCNPGLWFHIMSECAWGILLLVVSWYSALWNLECNSTG